MSRRSAAALGRSSRSILVAILPCVSLLATLSHCTRTDKTHAEKTSTQVAEVESALGPVSKPAAPTATTDEVYTPPPPLSSALGGRCIVRSAERPPPQVFPAERCPDDPTGPLVLPFGTVSFPDAPDKPSVRVELARDQESRTRGLMYRTQLEQDQGMLFTWRDARLRSFWMKNTCLPLDMLFIDEEGYIVGILENVPTMNLQPRRVRCPAQHVLEVNAGWTRKHRVFAGQKLTIEE